MEFPELFPSLSIVAHDVAWDILDASLVVTGFVAGKYHYYPVYHNRRRGAGNLS